MQIQLTENILKALSFASLKHRDQRRKDQEASPYVNHLIEVTRLLWEVGEVREEAVLVAAILHDTIEDTETTAEEITEIFGEEVANLVQEVTDDKSLAKGERKRLQIVNAPHKSHGAKQIKLADKCSNVFDIINSPPKWPIERKMEYLFWANAVVDGLRGANQALENRFDELLELGQKRLKETEV